MKQIKDFIAKVLYHIVLLAVKILPSSSGDKHLLIIKTDEIGDYMLFRNMLAYFRKSEKYKGYRITLVGNAAWKPIFDVYDAATVDDVIWLNKKPFNKDLGYRFRILKQVKSLKTSDVVNCIFSRSMILDDGFAFVATGRVKTAMKGNNANRGKYGFNLDGLIYTDILDPGDERLFESIRNSRFYSQLLEVKTSPDVRLQVKSEQLYSFTNYFLIFIGAGNKPERRWPLENFMQCAAYVSEKYGLLPVICGGPPDEPEAQRLVGMYDKEIVNLAGKTTLPGFIELASKARFLLSVDTGPVHMAAAGGCPVVALFSGVYYGRYAPYPQEAAHPFFSVYPDEIDELVAAKSETVYHPFLMKNETIRTIPMGKVISAIDKLLEQS